MASPSHKSVPLWVWLGREQEGEGLVVQHVYLSSWSAPGHEHHSPGLPPYHPATRDGWRGDRKYGCEHTLLTFMNMNVGTAATSYLRERSGKSSATTYILTQVLHTVSKAIALTLRNLTAVCSTASSTITSFICRQGWDQGAQKCTTMSLPCTVTTYKWDQHVVIIEPANYRGKIYIYSPSKGGKALQFRTVLHVLYTHAIHVKQVTNR